MPIAPRQSGPVVTSLLGALNEIAVTSPCPGPGEASWASSAVVLAFLEHLPSKAGLKQLCGVKARHHGAITEVWKGAVGGAKKLASAPGGWGDAAKLFASVAVDGDAVEQDWADQVATSTSRP